MRVSFALPVILALLTGLSALGGTAGPDTPPNPAVEYLDDADGWINWERLVVKAVGVGDLPGDVENVAQALEVARAAATADAYRNLTRAVNSVRVSGDAYARDLAGSSDQARLRIECFIRSGRMVSQKQLPNRSFEVIVQAPLTGKEGLLSCLTPEAPSSEGKAPTALSETRTGLLLDARGLDVKPALHPRICDAGGEVVYDSDHPAHHCPVETGLAVYSGTRDQAARFGRIGDGPVVVKAVKVSPDSPTDLVISRRDARRIREADRRTGILSRCRVCILIGPAE